MALTTAPPSTTPYPERREQRRERMCIALVLLSGLGLLATYDVAVRTVRGQALDVTASRGRGVQPETIIGAASGLLGTISIVSLVGVMGLLIGVAMVRKRPVLAVVTGAIVSGAILTTEVLKHVIFERYPLVDAYSYGASLNTLPSGHSTVAMGVVIAMILVLPRRTQGIAAALGAPYAIGTGIATIIAGWHRPSDVLAAWFVVGGWTFAGLIVLRRLGAWRPDERSSWERLIAPGLLILLVGTIVALATTTVVGLTGYFRVAGQAGRVSALRHAMAFGLSTAVIATAAMAFIGALLWILRDVRLER